MKTTTSILKLFLLVFTFLFISVDGQNEKVDSIVIDALKPFHHSLKRIDKDDVLNIHFKNVNPFLYKINIKVNEESYHDISEKVDPTTLSPSLSYRLPEIKDIPDLNVIFSIESENYIKENKDLKKVIKGLKDKKKSLEFILINLDLIKKKQEFDTIYNSSITKIENKINSIDIGEKYQNLNLEELNEQIDLIKGNEEKSNSEEFEELFKRKRKLSLEEKKNKLIKEYNELLLKYKEIEFETKDYQINLSNIRYDSLTEKIEVIEKQINEKEELINKNNLKVDEKALIRESFEIYKLLSEKILSLNSLYTTYLNIAYTSTTREKYKVEKEKIVLKFYEQLNKEHQKLKGYYEKIEQEDRDISNLHNIYFEIKHKLNGIYYDIQKTLMNKENRDFKNNLRSFHSKIEMSLIKELIKNIIVIDSFQDEEYWNPKISFGNYDYRTDDLHFEIKLTPNSIPMPIEVGEKRYDFKVAIKGGFKFSISLGTSVLTGLNDVEFQKVARNDTSSILIASSENSKKVFNGIKPHLTTFLNVYLRGKRQFQPTLNLGIGTNTEDISYLFGIGGIIGRQERIILHTGIAFTQAKVFNPYYQKLIDNDNDGESLGLIVNKPLSEFSDDEILIDKYKLGLYFGISYNLSKNREEKFQKFTGK